MNEIIEITVNDLLDSSISDSIYDFRRQFASYNFKKYNSEVMILLSAYNGLEKTKQCVNSLISTIAGIDCDIWLWDNGSTDGTFEYFKDVKYGKKHIVHVNKNIGSTLPWQYFSSIMLSPYVVGVPADLIFTHNWLSNLLTVAKSDERIGMVNPVSSNVSNLQQVDLDFNNYEEMQEQALKYNISDPSKWHERLRLITLAALYKKECINAIGLPVSDPGFAHNFGDDDITFRVRRAGYKSILAGDTWVHHNHEVNNMTSEQIQKFNDNLVIGRQNFRDKYFGIDAWDDVNNFIPEILPQIKPTADKENCTILGIDVRCGTPILEIKNHLRKYDIFDAICCAVTSEGKYFIDLQTVCGADNVFACSPAEASECFKQEVFEYIIIGENINEYPEPFRIIRHVYSLLKKSGQMFVYLKNDYDLYTFMNVIGHRNVRPSKNSMNLTIEQFIEQLTSMDIKAEVAGVVPHTNVPEDYINEVNNRMSAFVQDEWSETVARLTADRFVIIITK